MNDQNSLTSRRLFTIVRPFFSLGRKYYVYNPDGSLFFFVERPWFRLRQELVFYSDLAQLQPVLVVKSRRLVAFAMEHDIFEANGGVRLGSIRSRPFRSIFRDSWEILDPEDRVAGHIEEYGPALLRRLIRLWPGRHHIELGGVEVAHLQQIFHLWAREFELRLLPVADPIEPRLAVACALLAVMADISRERSE